MQNNQILSTILLVLASIAIFLMGLRIMSEHLERQASNRLRRLFNKATKNNLVGVGIGVGVTAIIQSSSATTVMVIGFVNAGILSLTQAATIIMGANVGTTITAVIISLPITELMAALGIVGIFIIMLSKKSNIVEIGYIIMGLSMIFMGLAVLSNSMVIIAQLQIVKRFFATTTNPFLLILGGAILTALMQSSSATTGILISVAKVQLITIESSIFLILGINIGTCITAIFASFGASTNARRAAGIHLAFNILGTIIIGASLAIPNIRLGLLAILGQIGTTFSQNFYGSQVAAFHIFFNVATTLILLPFIGLIVKFVTLILSEKKETEQAFTFKYLDELILLSTPSIAVAQIKKEIIRMYNLAIRNLDLSIDAILNLNLKNIEEFQKREDYINWLNKETPFFITKLSARHITFDDKKIVSSYYHVIIDIERIGDYAENIIEYAQRMDNNNLDFTEEAKEGISSMYKKIQKLHSLVLFGFKNTDLSLSTQINAIEDKIDRYKQTLSSMHLKRLNDNTCDLHAGTLFLSLISNLERIADHIKNIFDSIEDYKK